MNILHRKSGSGAGSVIAVLAGALAAAFASSLCCIAPLMYLLFGISAASLSGLGQTSAFRVPFAALALLLSAAAFRKIHSSRKICGACRISKNKLFLLYWTALPVILFFVFYPVILPLIYEAFE